MTKQHVKVLIAGGGSGGICLAARLAKGAWRGHIAVLEPSTNHFYQPYWTLAGVGVVAKESSCRPLVSLLPQGVHWIKDSVAAFAPETNQLQTAGGATISYDILVVATGLELNYEKIKGLEGNLGKDGLCTVYRYDQVDQAAAMVRDFKGGVAVFTMPPVPIKCAGAPQKVMYLADNLWRKNGVRAKSNLIFAAAGPTIFGVKAFADELTKVIQRKHIETKFQHKLVEIKAKQRQAIFETPNGLNEIAYDFLHVVPPMSAPACVRESALASEEEGQKGWLCVDKHTLQHKKFANVFGIGDVTGIPNSKTGAAIRKQAPIVAANIQRYLRQEPLAAAYDGYSSCPLTTEIGKVLLAEFGYDGKLLPSFPLNPMKERRIYWHLKKDLLPLIYWHGMLKGRL